MATAVFPAATALLRARSRDDGSVELHHHRGRHPRPGFAPPGREFSRFSFLSVDGSLRWRLGRRARILVRALERQHQFDQLLFAQLLQITAFHQPMDSEIGARGKGVGNYIKSEYLAGFASEYLAGLNRNLQLAKDWECLNRKALAFLRLASIRLMLRKLCNPA
jgi:hypothetical protein